MVTAEQQEEGWRQMADYIRQDLSRVETSINSRIDRLEASVKGQIDEVKTNLTSTEGRLQDDILDFHTELKEHIKDEEVKFENIHDKLETATEKISLIDAKSKLFSVIGSRLTAWVIAISSLGGLIFHFLTHK